MPPPLVLSETTQSCGICQSMASHRAGGLSYWSCKSRDTRGWLPASQRAELHTPPLSRLFMEQCGRCSEPRQGKGSPSFPSSISVVLLKSQSSCPKADPADPFWDFRLAVSFGTLCPKCLALRERSTFYELSFQQ